MNSYWRNNKKMPSVKPLTVKEKQYLNAYVETGSMSRAGRQVRLELNNNATAVATCSSVKSPNVLSRLEQVFDSVGLTETAIALKLKDKTDAKRQLFFAHNGIVTETREVEDHQAQLKATEMAARLRGMDIQRHANLNVNMTGEDLQALRNADLDSMLAQCENELNRMKE